MMAEAGVDGIPDYLTAEPVAPEVSWGKGSLGSVVLALRGGDPGVLKATAECYAKRFRKQWLDLREGLAVFMAPSRAHEARTVDARGLVESLGAALGLPVVALASTTVRAGREGRSGDPDESFYIGEKAEVYKRLIRSGASEDDIDAWADGQPVDLVVEVEHTHYDETKRWIYRDAGIRELWEIATPQAGRETAMVHLQAAGEPELVDASEAVPGVRSEGLASALSVLRQVGGAMEFARALERGEPVADALMAAAGVDEPWVKDGPQP